MSRAQQAMPDLGEPYVAFAETVQRDRWNLRMRLDLLSESTARALAGMRAEGLDETVRFTPGFVVQVHAWGDAKRSLDQAAGGVVEEDSWYEVGFGDKPDEMDVDLFAGSDPIADAEQHPGIFRFAPSTAHQAQLRQVFQPRPTERVDTAVVSAVLSTALPHQPRRVLVYDVGQGNANAVCDGNNMPLVYFDLGGGCYKDAHTYPVGARQTFCWSADQPVVLSHFDFDHLYSATLDQDSWRRRWIVPDGQQYGSTTAGLLANIRAHGGSVHAWSTGPQQVTQRGLTIARPGPTEHGRNKSGLIARVELPDPNAAAPWPVLLPADVPFAVVARGAPALMQGLRGLVATHHGAARCNVGPPVGSGTVAFSAGLKNQYGHPIPAAKSHLSSTGWSRSLETQTAPLPSTGSIVLAPAPALHPPPCAGTACTLTPRQQ